jgi:hypothetical protein
MKKQNMFFALMVFIFLISCVSAGQKADIKIAEEVKLHEYISETESFLIVEPFIHIISMGTYQYKAQLTGWGDHIIPPGLNIFGVQFFSDIIYSEPTMISYSFEPGKTYRLYYVADQNEKQSWGSKNIGTIQFFIEERNIDSSVKEAAYLVFSKANPDYLEGTWTYSKKYPFEDYEIKFLKKRFFTRAFNRVSKKEVIMEGDYFFNENTIILYCEMRNKKSFFQKEILNYELKNGILYIESGGNAASDTAGGMKGEYNKK